MTASRQPRRSRADGVRPGLVALAQMCSPSRSDDGRGRQQAGYTPPLRRSRDALTRTSTASTRAYVATSGPGRKQVLAQDLATSDSPMPVNRNVRVATSAPRPRSRNAGARGPTTSAASRAADRATGRDVRRRGGGRASLEPCRSDWARPRDGMRQACLRLVSGKGSPGVPTARAARPPSSDRPRPPRPRGGDRLAGQVVRCRAQAAGRDHEVGPDEAVVNASVTSPGGRARP